MHEPRFLTLLLTFVLFIAFPLPVCTAPSERQEVESAPGKASQPGSIPLSKSGSMITSEPMGGYVIPSWADLAILAGLEPGPVLMVVAGVHGDEASGTMAARLLAAEAPPARGTLFILPVASPEALATGQRWLPGWSDLNRAFPVAGENWSHGTAGASGITGTGGTDKATGSTQSARPAYAVFDPTYLRAEEILALIASIRPDLLLDLHESDYYWTEGDDPALVVPASARSAELALELLESPGLEGFSFTGPPPASSLVSAVNSLFGLPALLVEAPDALTVDGRIAVYHAVVGAAMQALGMGNLATIGVDLDNPRPVDADGSADFIKEGTVP